MNRFAKECFDKTFRPAATIFSARAGSSGGKYHPEAHCYPGGVRAAFAVAGWPSQENLLEEKYSLVVWIVFVEIGLDGVMNDFGEEYHPGKMSSGW
jgi:hypothetical protein